jgi:hypothetical protein
VRRIHDQDVHAGADERAGARVGIRAAADRGGHAEPAVLVLVRVGMLAALEDVLHGDQALENAIGVHHRQLLDPVLRQDPLGVVEAGADRRGDEPILGHRVADRLLEIALELEIAVGDDADQPSLSVHDRDAGDLEAPHQDIGLAQRAVGTERDRVENHPALAPLHPVHLRGLALGRHVLVEDAHAAGPRHRDGHVGLGDGVHGGGDQRDVEGDGAGEAADSHDLARMHRGVSRHQEDIVEGEARLGPNDGHALLSCR